MTPAVCVCVCVCVDCQPIDLNDLESLPAGLPMIPEDWMTQFNKEVTILTPLSRCYGNEYDNLLQSRILVKGVGYAPQRDSILMFFRVTEKCM